MFYPFTLMGFLYLYLYLYSYLYLYLFIFSKDGEVLEQIA